eukprot:COSAG01_NODE_14801_length_1408_cov_3.154316_1_plen_237_part_00
MVVAVMWLAGWCWCWWHGMAGRAAVVPRPAPRARAGHRPDRRRAGCVRACVRVWLRRPLPCGCPDSGHQQLESWPAGLCCAVPVPVPVPVLLLLVIAHRGHPRTHAPPTIAAIFERVWAPSSLAARGGGGAAASQRRWVDSGEDAAASSSPSSSPVATMLTDADDRSSLAALVAGAYRRRRRRRLLRWLAGCPSCFWNRFQSKFIGKSQSILGAFGIDWNRFGAGPSMHEGGGGGV